MGKKVQVVRNGEVIVVDESKVEAAKGQGFTPVSDQKADEIVRMREASTLGGELQGAGEAALSGLSFGGTDVAAVELFGADPEDLAARREGKGLFEAAGAIAPALISGGAGAVATGAKAAGTTAKVARGIATATPAGLAAKAGGAVARGRGLAGAAAGAALEGGAQGAGVTFSEAALGGPDVTAQRLGANIATGAGLGAVLGGGMHATGGVFNRALRPRKGLADVIDSPAAIKGEAAAQAIEGTTRGFADSAAGKVARKAWKLSGAADDDISTLLNMMPDKEGRRLILEGPEALARSRTELAERIKAPVDRSNAAWNGVVKTTGGDSRIANFERLLTGAENATAPVRATQFMRELGEKIDDRLAKAYDPEDGLRLISEGEVQDLKKLRSIHREATKNLEKAGVSGAEAMRIVDKARQSVRPLREAQFTHHRRSGAPEALRGANTADEFYKAYRGHTVDEKVYGAAAKAHAEDIAAFASGLGAVDDLGRKSKALAKVFDPKNADADITPLLSLARGRAGKTKEAFFDDVFKAREKALDVLERNHELPDAVRKEIAAFKQARKEMDDAIEANAKRVEQVEAVWRVRQMGESGFSPSNVGAQGAAAVGGALGFGVGGVPGALLGAAAGAVTKPFTTSRWLAAAWDAVESAKLREHGIITGAARAMDGAAPKAAKTARGFAAVAKKGLAKSGESARRGATTLMADRRRRALLVRDKINDITADPSILANEFEDADAWENAPDTTKAQLVTAARAAAFLKSVEPRTYKPLFSSVELVDPVEIERYERSYEAVVDPYTQLEKLWAGGTAVEHIDAIEAVYPEMLQHVRNGIMDEIGKRELEGRAVDYRTRARLGKVLRMPLDDTQRPGVFDVIQTSVTPPPPPMTGGATQGRGPNQIEDIKAENAMTSSERRESGVDRA